MDYKLWDKENKEFLEDDWETEYAVLANGTVIEIYDNGFAEGYSVRNLDNIEVLQFTGLKDKNGKEIYEGDIVILNDTEEENRCVVKYKYGSYILIDGDLREDLSNVEDRFLEVVGNIYENKNLLEGNKKL